MHYQPPSTFFRIVLATGAIFALSGCALFGPRPHQSPTLGLDPVLRNESAALALMLSGGLALAEEEPDRAVADLERASVQVSKPEAELIAEIALLRARAGKIAEGLHSIERLPEIERKGEAAKIYAGLLEAQGKLKEAQSVLNADVQSGPLSFDTAFERAYFARRLGDQAEADKVWTAYLADPQNGSARLRTFAHYFMAQNSEDRGDFTKAAEGYASLLSSPERGDILVLDLLRVLLASGQRNKAREVAEEQLIAIKDPAVARLVKSFATTDGPLLASHKDLQLLRDVQDAAVNPRVRLAGILLGEGDARGANRELSLSLAIDPNDGMARYQLANLLNIQGKRKEAIDEAERVSPKSDLFVRAQVFAAIVAKQLEDPARSERALSRAISREPDNIQLYLLLAQLLRDQDNYVRAVGVLNDAPISVRADVSLLQLRAQLFYEQGLSHDAFEICRKLHAQDPQNAEVANFLAFLIADIPLTDQLDFADGLVKAALTVAPAHPYFLDTAAWILKQRGKLEEAVTVEAKALQESGDDISLHSHYAQLLWLTGKRTEAKQECERLVSVGASARGRIEKQMIEKARVCSWD